MTHTVIIDGVPYQAPKGFYHGTHRTTPPERTLSAIWRVAPTVGLTRLADVTGLDRIGVPTVVGYRPNAPTLAVSGGKGYTTLAATVSAGMEAVEIWHAENPIVESVVAPYAALAREGLTMPEPHLPLMRNPLFDPNRPERWAWGWDLVTQRKVAVPYASMSMGNTNHAQTQRWTPFVAGSNGLAGGNHLLEATAAALFELVERDAISCCKVADGGLSGRVDLDSVVDPLVRSLLDQFDAADITTYLFDCTVDTDIPSYMAIVADRVDISMGMYRGYGAHLDPSIAMIRALTEAAQSRLLLIAGSRDDYFGRDQRMNRSNGANRQRAIDDLPAQTDANRHRNAASDSFGQDVNTVVARLLAAGLDSVVVVNLTHPDLGIPVARAVVPGLEGYLFDHYRPGPRALARKARVAVPA